MKNWSTDLSPYSSEYIVFEEVVKILEEKIESDVVIINLAEDSLTSKLVKNETNFAFLKDDTSLKIYLELYKDGLISVDVRIHSRLTALLAYYRSDVTIDQLERVINRSIGILKSEYVSNLREDTV